MKVKSCVREEEEEGERVMVYMVMFPCGEEGGEKETCIMEEERVVRRGGETPSGAKERKEGTEDSNGAYTHTHPISPLPSLLYSYNYSNINSITATSASTGNGAV